MIIPAHYEDLHTHHVGTTPNRCYFIPASKRMDDLVEHRENSDRFQLLNGNWKFKYCENVHDFEDLFYEQGYDASGWDTIPVPSVWQNHGYDRHQYTNIRYPFPADPPYVPYENPCGAYLCDFVYAQNPEAPKAYLNFEGVDSCFYVWLQRGISLHFRIRYHRICSGRQEHPGCYGPEVVRRQLPGRPG